MTREFDSGLVDELGRPLAFRTAIRNEVIGFLTKTYQLEVDGPQVGILLADGGFIRKISKLAAPLQTFETDEAAKKLFDQLLGQAPAIAVAVGDREVKPAGIGGGRDFSTVEVHVYFYSSHQRSLIARVEADVVATGDGEDLEPEDGADRGLDVAMELAEEMLSGKRLDTERGVVKHMQLKREHIVAADARYVLAEQVWSVGVSRSINLSRGVLQRLLGIHTVVRPATETPESPAAVVFDTELAEES